ncbi:hypothetical protein AMTR_s00078p00152820 [Amborella trichopoda]|uniref:Uncharacterized protein n=1 Tax=Amborella trichopoda TaxID=13333 RepID=W1P7F1_AMBTC|nr:hypothetical protein AMTR_s00078p00152820 [Amborella trichopoda]
MPLTTSVANGLGHPLALAKPQSLNGWPKPGPALISLKRHRSRLSPSPSRANPTLAKYNKLKEKRRSKKEKTRRKTGWANRTRLALLRTWSKPSPVLSYTHGGPTPKPFARPSNHREQWYFEVFCSLYSLIHCPNRVN